MNRSSESCSYGFRPRRSTIECLRQVAQAYQAGATWIIEGDLVKCFDSIPHGVILNCLRKRIKDERFIDLIRQMLQAGVIEEGSYTRTYSGTPQGGLASPILSNIVLHEFDRWMEDQWQANPPPLTAHEQNARINPEYARHKRNLVRWRAQLACGIPMGRQTPEGLRTKIQAALKARKRVPSVLPRRLISYCRYADDYVAVLCQGSKAEAQQLKTAMAHWLQGQLGLTQHPLKTRITHWDRRIRFLGYDLRGRRNLNGTRWLRVSKVVTAKDIQPLPLMSWAQGRSYEQRQALRAARGQRCQHCGQSRVRLMVHHPNRLGRKAKRKNGPANVITSGQMQQVKLLCLECHKRHHPGGWRGKPKRRQHVTGELGAATSCLPSSEGAGRKRAAVM